MREGGDEIGRTLSGCGVELERGLFASGGLGGRRRRGSFETFELTAFLYVG